MSKDLTVLSIMAFALLAIVLCLEQTLQKSEFTGARELTMIFALEIFLAALCAYSIYFLTRKIVFKRWRFGRAWRGSRPKFSPVSFSRFLRSEFPPRFWKRQTSAPKV
jgi:membrane glycosyltransferase